jgi:hypothetical protein
MRKITFLPLAATLLGAGLLAAAGAALAADPSAQPSGDRAARRAELKQRFFDQIDTNHDGTISRAEYQAWVDARFAKLDTNGDGRVDAQEIESSPVAAERVQKRAEAFVKRYDTSGTGKVDKADFEAKEMARFDRLSGGADTLTPEQLAAPRGAWRGQHKNGD